MNELNWQEIGIFLVLFLGASAWFFWKSRRQINEHWSGTIVSVSGIEQGRWVSSESGGSERRATTIPALEKIEVICKLDDGPTKKITLTRLGFGSSFPEGLYPGDRIVKEAGSPLFHVINESR